MNLITSSKNPLIKHLSKLNICSSYRKEQNSFVIEGKKLILEWLQKNPIKQLIVQEGLPSLSNIEPIYIKKELSKKISSLKTNEGYFAEVSFPQTPTNLKFKKLLVLDQIQDPQNLGALARSALAFNFDALFILDGSTHPFSPKAIRSSMGAVLHTPIFFGDYQQFEKIASEQNLTVYIADANGKPLQNDLIKHPFALVLGNESQGSGLKNNSKYHKISIPISNVDSLNVAIAGSLLMYELKGVE